MEGGVRRILAIGAHVGDVELTSGGLLATCAVQGGAIMTLALTAGEKGGPAGVSPQEHRGQKLQEAETFARMLGGEAKVLEHSDGLLPDDDAVRFEVCDVIRQFRPDMIITHHTHSMHKDHSVCRRIVDDARFYAAVPGFERELPACGVREMYYAENWEDAEGFTPYVYFDIEPGFELWKKAMQTHWFIMNSKSYPYYEYYTTLARLRGIAARKHYAEAYMAPPEVHRIVKEL